ncbi:hypothetical protein TCAL_15446 [Tigriopus californicus]|uniref:Uncharacterized protein n=1 Tax=Tigriopus californicus TaxID=6832 RepID=A0A553PSX3_TIGCA|nr:hypothetical protein TCAL_15446 [Tigriopus californicus]
MFRYPGPMHKEQEGDCSLKCTKFTAYELPMGPPIGNRSTECSWGQNEGLCTPKQSDCLGNQEWEFDVNLGIMELDVESCKYASNTWTPMPLPRKKIQGRGLSILNGRPIVIGGVDTTSTETDSVEIFDPISNQWIDGPKLTQARAFQSHVQVNDVTIIILGGYFKKEIAITSLLSAGDTQWTELPDRPQAVTFSLNGMHRMKEEEETRKRVLARHKIRHEEYS